MTKTLSAIIFTLVYPDVCPRYSHAIDMPRTVLRSGGTFKRGLTSDFIAKAAQNKGAWCFAAYGGFEGYASPNADKECATSVGLEFPTDFIERWGSDSVGIDSELLRKFSHLYRLQSGNDLHAFQNHCAKASNERCVYGGRPVPHKQFNASLAIFGAKSYENTTFPDSVAFSLNRKSGNDAYFSTLQDLRDHCEHAKAALSDLIWLGFLYFNLKEAPPQTWPSLPSDEKWATDSIGSLWFCAHNTKFMSEDWGVQASVPYFHLHTTNRDDYAEFQPWVGSEIGPRNFTTPTTSWVQHGGACARFQNSGDASRVTTFQQTVEEIAHLLLDLLPPKSRITELFEEIETIFK